MRVKQSDATITIDELRSKGADLGLGEVHLKHPRYAVWEMHSAKHNELKGRFHTLGGAVIRAEQLSKNEVYIYILHWPENADRPVVVWDSFDGADPSDKRAALRKFSQGR